MTAERSGAARLLRSGAARVRVRVRGRVRVRVRVRVTPAQIGRREAARLEIEGGGGLHLVRVRVYG